MSSTRRVLTHLPLLQEIRRFFVLKGIEPDLNAKILSPSVEVDRVWHALLLFPLAYADVCKIVLPTDLSGFLIDHNPFGASDLDRTSRYARTLKKYREIFDEVPPVRFWEPITPKTMVIRPPANVPVSKESQNEASKKRARDEIPAAGNNLANEAASSVANEALRKRLQEAKSTIEELKQRLHFQEDAYERQEAAIMELRVSHGQLETRASTLGQLLEAHKTARTVEVTVIVNPNPQIPGSRLRVITEPRAGTSGLAREAATVLFAKLGKSSSAEKLRARAYRMDGYQYSGAYDPEGVLSIFDRSVWKLRYPPQNGDLLAALLRCF
jgi:hypothetical protein